MPKVVPSVKITQLEKPPELIIGIQFKCDHCDITLETTPEDKKAKFDFKSRNWLFTCPRCGFETSLSQIAVETHRVLQILDNLVNDILK